MDQSTTLCKQCGKIINPLKGRSDRLYCDEKCKNKYHNARNKEDDVEFKRVQRVLRTNRKILKKMFIRDDRDEIQKTRLLKAGFEFDYHTHTKLIKIKSNLLTFCFE